MKKLLCLLGKAMKENTFQKVIKKQVFHVFMKTLGLCFGERGEAECITILVRFSSWSHANIKLPKNTRYDLRWNKILCYNNIFIFRFFTCTLYVKEIVAPRKKCRCVMILGTLLKATTHNKWLQMKNVTGKIYCATHHQTVSLSMALARHGYSHSIAHVAAWTHTNGVLR